MFICQCIMYCTLFIRYFYGLYIQVLFFREIKFNQSLGYITKKLKTFIDFFPVFFDKTHCAGWRNDHSNGFRLNIHSDYAKIAPIGSATLNLLQFLICYNALLQCAVYFELGCALGDEEYVHGHKDV